MSSLTARSRNFSLTAETVCVDPVLSLVTEAFTLCDESGNSIVDESDNIIGGDTNYLTKRIKLTAKRRDFVLTTEA